MSWPARTPEVKRRPARFPARHIALCLLLALALVSCGASASPTPTSVPEPVEPAPTAAPSGPPATADPSPAAGGAASPQATPTRAPAAATAPPATGPAATTTPTPEVVQSEPAGGWPQYVVSGTAGLGLWLRRAPGGEQLRIYTEGTPLQQLGPDREAAGLVWRSVRTPDGAEGWVAAKYVALERFVVTGTQGEGLRLRRSPGGEAIGSYRDGTRLDQIGPDREEQGALWRHVRAPGEVEGWVAAEYTILAAQAPPPPVAPPARLAIPTIGVDAPVEFVGLTPDGAMDVPSGPWSVGWYQPGTPPGAVGSAVIAGHVDYRGVGPAVFWRLRDLAPGDVLVVVSEDGSERRFRVTDVVSYPFDDMPLEQIFGPAASPRLNLITCEGTFDARARNYDQRLVVYAEAEE